MRNKIIIFILILAMIIAGFIYHPLIGVLIIIALLATAFYFGRGMLYLMLHKAESGKGNEDGARRWLDKAYHVAPNNVNIAITYSYDLLRNDETEQASEVLNTISAAQLPKETEISYQLNSSIVLWRQGKKEESISLVEELYSKYKNTVIYGSLGYYYILNGQLEQALQINEEAYAFNDSNNAILDNLGLTYYYLERYDEAFNMFNKLIKNEPKFREAYYNMGLLYEMREQWQAAYDQYKRALEYKPALVSHVSLEEIEARLADIEPQVAQSMDKEGDMNGQSSEVDS